jgi:hypothetical protein
MGNKKGHRRGNARGTSPIKIKLVWRECLLDFSYRLIKRSCVSPLELIAEACMELTKRPLNVLLG